MLLLILSKLENVLVISSLQMIFGKPPITHSIVPTYIGTYFRQIEWFLRIRFFFKFLHMNTYYVLFLVRHNDIENIWKIDVDILYFMPYDQNIPTSISEWQNIIFHEYYSTYLHWDLIIYILHLLFLFRQLQINNDF